MKLSLGALPFASISNIGMSCSALYLRTYIMKLSLGALPYASVSNIGMSCSALYLRTSFETEETGNAIKY